VNSLDTNILLYAINTDCPEHARCHALVQKAISETNGWIVADQVWFELYRLLRNPAVLQMPLDATTAASTISWYRTASGWLNCAWEPAFMTQLGACWKMADFRARSTFDLVLAITLAQNGVETFHTRNTSDFDDLGLFGVVNPLA
jgi:toxin-antitoxin system PIN domain toxin